MLLIQCASVHYLVSSSEQMLSEVFILPDGVSQITALHRECRDIIAITYSKKHLHCIYMYLLTSLWQILLLLQDFKPPYSKSWSVLLVSLTSSCPSVILIAALLLNSRRCTAKALQIPSLIFRKVLGYARDPGSKDNNISSYSLSRYKIFRDHQYYHSSVVSTPDPLPSTWEIPQPGWRKNDELLTFSWLKRQTDYFCSERQFCSPARSLGTIW